MRRTLALAFCALWATGPAFAQNQINGSPISQLPQATTPLSGTEIVPLVQGGTTKQVPISSLPAGALSIPVPITQGGCAATTAAGCVANLGVSAATKIVSPYTYDTNTCTGSGHDDGPAIQSAVNALGSNGGAVVFPAGILSCYIGTQVNISASNVTVDFSGDTVYVPSVTAFAVTGSHVTFQNGYVFGNRSASNSNRFMQETNSAYIGMRNMRFELLNTIAEYDGGFFETLDDIFARNIVYAGFIGDKVPGTTAAVCGYQGSAPGVGVGTDLTWNNLYYDTDTGTYAQPTIGLFYQKDWSGFNGTNYDIIHGGQTADIYVAPTTCLIGDDRLVGGFLDIKGGDAVQINPQGSTAKVQRMNFIGVWMATGVNGLHITGSGNYDDINIVGGDIFNNSSNGVLIDNTGTYTSNVSATAAHFHGNNSTSGTASDVNLSPGSSATLLYTSTANVFNEAAKLTSAEPVYNIASNTNTNTNYYSQGDSVNYSGASSGHFQNTNGTSRVPSIILNGNNAWTGANSFSAALSDTVAPTSAWQFDASGQGGTSIATGGNAALPAGSGIVVATNITTGDTGSYVCGGNNCFFLGGSSSPTSWVASTNVPAAGDMSVAYDNTSAYRVYSNYGSTANFNITLIRNRALN